MQLLSLIRYSLVFVILLVGFAILPNQAMAIVQSNVELSVEELVKQLKSNDSSEQIAAAVELAQHKDRIDEFAKPLAMLTMSRTKLVRLSGERVFEYLGCDATAALKPLIHSSEPREFAAACNAVKAIGDEATDYRTVLVKQLSNDDRYFRVAAMHALSGFSNGAEDAVELIVKNLDDDENFNVNLFACRVLIKTGQSAKAATPSLVKLLNEGNRSQRSYAAWTLGAIGTNDEFATYRELESMLDSKTFSERERAMLGLGLMGADASMAADKVREMMNRPGSGLEPTAAFVLWQITGEAQPSVDRLIELGEKRDFEITALNRLSEMNSAAKPATEYLLSKMTNDDESVLEAAIDALGNIRDLSDDQKQILIAIKNSEVDPLVRLAAAIAIKKIAAFSDPGK